MDDVRAMSRDRRTMDDLRPQAIGRCGAVILLVALAACSDTSSSPEAERKQVRDVAFYLAHPEERAATIAGCRADPGGTGKDADCVNARSAEFRQATDPKNYGMPRPWGQK